MNAVRAKATARKLISGATAVFMGCCYSAALGAETLERGVAAFPTKDGHVYIGWRLLADDPADIAFEVYRSASPGGTERKLNRV